MNKTAQDAIRNLSADFSSFQPGTEFNAVQYDSEGRHFTGLNAQLLSVESQKHQYASSRWLSEDEIRREGITIPETAEPAELVIYVNSGIDQAGKPFVYDKPVMTRQKYYNLSALELPEDSRFNALDEIRISDISHKDDLLRLLSPNPDEEIINAVSTNNHDFCLERIRDIAKNPAYRLSAAAQEYFTWQICTDFGIRYQPQAGLQVSEDIIKESIRLRKSIYDIVGIDTNRQLRNLRGQRRSLDEVISAAARSQNNEYGKAIQNRLAEKNGYRPQDTAERQSASMQESSQNVRNRTDGKSEIEKGTIHNRNLNGRPDHPETSAISAALSYSPEHRNFSIKFSGPVSPEMSRELHKQFYWFRSGKMWISKESGPREELEPQFNGILEFIKSYGYEIKSQEGPEIQAGVSAVRPGSDSQEHSADAGGHGLHETLSDVVSGNEELHDRESELTRGNSSNLADPEIPASGNEEDDRHTDTGLRNAGTEGSEPGSRSVLQEGGDAESREPDARRPATDQADSARGTEGSSAPDVHGPAGKGTDDDNDQAAAGRPESGSLGSGQEEPLQDDISRPSSAELGMVSGGLGDVPLHREQDSRASGIDQAGSPAAETEIRAGNNGRPGISLGTSAALLDEQNVRDGKPGESPVTERGGRGSDGNRDDGDSVQNQPGRTDDPVMDAAGTGSDHLRAQNPGGDETGTVRAVAGEGEDKPSGDMSVGSAGRTDIPGSDSRGGEPVREDTAEVSGVPYGDSNVSAEVSDNEPQGTVGRGISDEPDVSHPNQDERAVSGDHGSDVNLNRNNYTIPDSGEDPAKISSKRQIINNLDALELALKLQKEGRQASPEEKEILAKFTGFGSLHPENFSELNERYKSVLSRISPDTAESTQFLGSGQTQENAFFTPHSIVQLIYDKLAESGFKGGNILEPSCGSGNFIGSVPEDLKNHVRFTGVEIDPAAALVAKYLYPDAEIVNTGIQNTIKKDFYDVAIGNVPFSDGTQGFENTEDIKAFLHFGEKKNLTLPQLVLGKAVQETRPGGIVAMIVPTGMMSNTNPADTNFRHQLAKQVEFLGASRIPRGGFDRTRTDVDLVFLKRREQEVRFDPEKYPDQVWAETVKLGSVINIPHLKYNDKGNIASADEQPSDVKGPRYGNADIYTLKNSPDKTVRISYDTASPLELAKQSINAYYAQNLDRLFPSKKASLTISLSRFSKGSSNNNGQEVTDHGKRYYFTLHADTLPLKSFETLKEVLTDKSDSISVTPADFLKQQLTENIHFEYTSQTRAQQEKTAAADAAITAAAKSAAEHPANRVYVEDGKARIRTSSGEVQTIKTENSEQLEIIAGLCELRDTASQLYMLQQDRNNDDPAIIALREKLNTLYNDLSDKYDKPEVLTEGKGRNKKPLKDKDGNQVVARKGLILSNIDFFRQAGGKNGHVADSLAELLYGLEKPDLVPVLTTVKDEETGESRAAETKVPVFGRLNQIFSENTVAVRTDPRSAGSDEEALLISKNMRGKIDIEYIARLRKSTPDEMAKSLLEKKLIYRDPETFDPARPLEGFVSRDDYLYGDLYLKIKAAKERHFDDNVGDLEAVMPPRIKAADIAVQIGQSWIPEKYYAQFLQQVVEKVSYQNNTDYDTRITRVGDLYSVRPLPPVAKNADGFDINNYERFYPANNKIKPEPYQILENLLNGSKQDITSVGDKKEIEEDTVRMSHAVQNMQDAFRQWIFADPERAADLEQRYNETFNAVRPKDYSAETESMIFHGMSSDIAMKDHQKRAVSRILHGDCNQLLAHCTGAGKTYEMLASAVEAQKLGLANKQILVFPKQVVGQASQSLQDLYPGLEGVLVYSSDDISDRNDRQAFLSRCLDPDVHFIIMTPEQFQKIPSDKEWIKEMNLREQSHVMSLIHEFEDNGVSRSSRSNSGMNKLKKWLQSLDREQKENDKRLADNADDGITFQQLGIDRIFVDEAHLFKNLDTSSQKSPVLSINGSNRAEDMYRKCSYLNEHSKKRPCVIFSTATPISNSVAEVYNMLRYLAPEKFEERGIYSIDGFANNFLSDRMGWETKQDGSFAPVITPDNWQNPDELMKIIRESWDILTEADLRRSGQVKLPNSHTNIIEVQKSETQSKLMDEIFARGARIRSGLVSPSEDNMLKISSDSKLLSIDERLTLARYFYEKQQLEFQKENLTKAIFNPPTENSDEVLNGILADPAAKFKDNHRSGTTELKDGNGSVISYRGFDLSLKKEVRKTTSGTEALYDEEYSVILHNPAQGENHSGDIAVKISDSGDAANDEVVFETGDIKIDRALASLKETIAKHSESIQSQFSTEIEMENDGTLARDVDSPSSKVNTCCDVIASTYRDNQDPDGKGTQIVFLDSSVNENINGFSVYNDLKKKLVERGIPANEIAVASDYKKAPGKDDDEKKANFFDRVNKGEIRVIIGSTGTIGTGVNMQEHVVAMHHLDVPWRPTDLDQRNGRGIRQGNKNSDVQTYYYVTKGTYDEIIWQKLLKKQKANLGLMQAGAANTRQKELTTGDADNGGNMSIEDLEKIRIAATGNPKLIDLSISEEKLQHLDTLADDFIKKKDDSGKVLKKFDSTVRSLQDRIQKREAEKALRDSAPQSLRLLNMPGSPEITGDDEIKKALLALKKADVSAFEKIDDTSLSPDGKEHETIYRVGTYRGFNLNFIVSDKRDSTPTLERNDNGGFSVKAGTGTIVRSYELQLQDPNDETRTFETKLREPKKALDGLLHANIEGEIASLRNRLDTERRTRQSAEDFLSKPWEDSDKYLTELKNNISLTLEVSEQMTRSDDLSSAKSGIADRIAIFGRVSGKTGEEVFNLLNENDQLEKLGFERPGSRDAAENQTEQQSFRTETAVDDQQKRPAAEQTHEQTKEPEQPKEESNSKSIAEKLADAVNEAREQSKKEDEHLEQLRQQLSGSQRSQSEAESPSKTPEKPQEQSGKWTERVTNLFGMEVHVISPDAEYADKSVAKMNELNAKLGGKESQSEKAQQNDHSSEPNQEAEPAVKESAAPAPEPATSEHRADANDYFTASDAERFQRIAALPDDKRKPLLELAAGFADKWKVKSETILTILNDELSGYPLHKQPVQDIYYRKFMSRDLKANKQNFEEYSKSHPDKFSSYITFRVALGNDLGKLLNNDVRPLLGIPVKRAIAQTDVFTGGTLTPVPAAVYCENARVSDALSTPGNKFITTNELLISIALAMNPTVKSTTGTALFNKLEKAGEIADDLLRKDAIAIDFSSPAGVKSCFSVADIDFVKLHEDYPKLESYLDFLKPGNQLRSPVDDASSFFHRRFTGFKKSLDSLNLSGFEQLRSHCTTGYRNQMTQIFHEYGCCPHLIDRAHISDSYENERDLYAKVVDDRSGKVIGEVKNGVDEKNPGHDSPEPPAKAGGNSGISR